MGAVIPPLPGPPGEEGTLLPAFKLCLLLRTPSGSTGARKASLMNGPFLRPAVLMFLEMGNFLLEASAGRQRCR